MTAMWPVKLSLFEVFWSSFPKQPGGQAWRWRNPLHTPTMPLVMCVILAKSLTIQDISWILHLSKNKVGLKEHKRFLKDAILYILSKPIMWNKIIQIKKKSLTTIYAKSDQLKATTCPLNLKCVILHKKIFSFQGDWVLLTPIYW